ncbi:MAG: DNA alkylation repair protein, partial [Phycisphaerae bacterium]
MTPKQALKELESAGTAQNRKVYARHGVQGTMFGVSFANLNKLKKKIKVDHDLAQALWNSGNHDARILATMVADHQALDRKTLEQWVKDVDCYVLGDALAGIAAKSSVSQPLMKKWIASKKEWVGSVGWTMLCHVATHDKSLDDDEFASYLPLIEETIHKAKNRVRYAMNGAMIAIGLRSAALQKD